MDMDSLFPDRSVQSAQRDPVTGLLSSFGLTQAAQRSTRYRSLLLLGVDDFKLFHATTGDVSSLVVLREVARRLTAYAPQTAQIARLGQDVFAVLLESTDISHATAIARRIVQKVTAPYSVNGEQVHFTVSQGVAVNQWWGELANHGLLEQAHAALRRARTQGKGRLACFDLTIEPDSTGLVSFLDDLACAMARNELSLSYQPVLDLATGEITSVEAKLGWNRRGMRYVPAEAFVPVAETFGLMAEIGDWVLDGVCGQIREWRDGGHLGWTVSIDVVASQVCDPRFTRDLHDRINRWGIAPADICIEAAEAKVIQHLEVASPTLRDLSYSGVACTLDGFGVGGADLLQLQSLPIDKIKIDRSLVCGVVDNRHDVTLVDAIVSLSRALGVRVVAEGVESLEQHVLLKELGCDGIQGDYVGGSMTGAEVPDFVWGASSENPLAMQ